MNKNYMLLAARLFLLSSTNVLAQQTVPGLGNAYAVQVANASTKVQCAHQFDISQAKLIQNEYLREQTLDGVTNPKNLHPASRESQRCDAQGHCAATFTQGLLNPGDEFSKEMLSGKAVRR